MHARIQIYWCTSSIFRHLKLELLTQFPASNDEKYINVVYIWRKFVSFYGYVHWRMTTEISVMYGSEKVNSRLSLWLFICLVLTLSYFIKVLRQREHYIKAQCMTTFLLYISWPPWLYRRWPWYSGWSCLLGKSEIAGLNPALEFKFQRNLLTRMDSTLWGASVIKK